MKPFALIAIVALVLSGCTTRQVVENTGDAVVGTGKLVVRGAVGAGKLAGRGAVAGVRQIRTAQAGYSVGDRVCVNADGEVLGKIEVIDGQETCILV